VLRDWLKGEEKTGQKLEKIVVVSLFVRKNREKIRFASFDMLKAEKHV